MRKKKMWKKVWSLLWVMVLTLLHLRFYFFLIKVNQVTKIALARLILPVFYVVPKSNNSMLKINRAVQIQNNSIVQILNLWICGMKTYDGLKAEMETIQEQCAEDKWNQRTVALKEQWHFCKEFEFVAVILESMLAKGRKKNEYQS